MVHRLFTRRKFLALFGTTVFFSSTRAYAWQAWTGFWQNIQNNSQNAIVPTILNSSDKGPDVTLSNGGLTAAITNYESVRSVASRSSGKYYVEFLIGTGTGSVNALPGVGIANSSEIVNAYTSCPNGLIYSGYGGYYRAFGGVSSGHATYAYGDRVMAAIDLDALKVWFGKNGGWCDGGDPGTNSGGLSIPSGTYYLFISHQDGGSTTTTVVTVNSGASAFVYSVPTGFKSGFG